MATRSRITPFMKQCYVTAGVSLNMLSHGLVSGFSAVLLPQLRRPDSQIKIDETSESWIASAYGVTFVVGNIISSMTLDKFSRKTLNLMSIFIMAAGWYMTVWSSSVTLLIVSRIIQGLALGISIHLCPIMVGEYTSPRNRGAFLATINLAISFGIVLTHSLGSFLRWQTTALICAVIMTIDFFIVSFSPETPICLARNGKYEECKDAFRWLRGFDEEEELTRIIKDSATMQSKKSKYYKGPIRKILNKLHYFNVTMFKREFYIPSLIVIHFYVLGQWGGITILSQFTSDVFTNAVGDAVDVATMTVILSSHRFVSGIYMSIFMDKFKRRTLAISFGLITAVMLLCIAGYAYARPRNILPFDHPAIGVILIHIHMVSVCSGCLALGFIVAGELFPLEYKGLAGGLSATFLSGNIFVMAKTGPYFLRNLGIHVAYSIYAAVTIYCTVMIAILLPETKGKTLQEVEDVFRNRRCVEQAETAEPLTES